MLENLPFWSATNLLRLVGLEDLESKGGQNWRCFWGLLGSFGHLSLVVLLLRSAKAPLRGKALGCGDLGAGAGRSRSQRQMPLGSSWAVGFQSRLTAEPEDWNGTLEPWNPGTPELRNDASSCIIMIHHDPSCIVIITGHVVRESFIFEAHIVLCWVLLFMNCQPRIESVYTQFTEVPQCSICKDGSESRAKVAESVSDTLILEDVWRSIHESSQFGKCWAMLSDVGPYHAEAVSKVHFTPWTNRPGGLLIHVTSDSHVVTSSLVTVVSVWYAMWCIVCVMSYEWCVAQCKAT